jgi:hypothetical protein
VKEERDPGVRRSVPKELRQQHQVIVVDPNQIARLEVVHHRVAESLVGSHVRIPVGSIELEPGRELVEQRPQRLVGVALVEAVEDLGREIHTDAVMVTQPRGQRRLVAVVVLHGSLSRPADPQPVHLAHHGAEGAHQPTWVPHSPPRRTHPPHGHRKPVRHDDQSPGTRHDRPFVSQSPLRRKYGLAIAGRHRGVYRRVDTRTTLTCRAAPVGPGALPQTLATRRSTFR